MKDCKECKYFIYCDLSKQAFHKLTNRDCAEYKEEETQNAGNKKGNSQAR